MTSLEGLSHKIYQFVGGGGFGTGPLPYIIAFGLEFLWDSCRCG